MDGPRGVNCWSNAFRQIALPVCWIVIQREVALMIPVRIAPRPMGFSRVRLLDGFGSSAQPGLRKSLRKEVIQPQVLLRLPCYDFVPVTSLAVGTAESRRLRALPASMT